MNIFSLRLSIKVLIDASKFSTFLKPFLFTYSNCFEQAQWKSYILDYLITFKDNNSIYTNKYKVWLISLIKLSTLEAASSSDAGKVFQLLAVLLTDYFHFSDPNFFTVIISSSVVPVILLVLPFTPYSLSVYFRIMKKMSS